MAREIVVVGIVGLDLLALVVVVDFVVVMFCLRGLCWELKAVLLILVDSSSDVLEVLLELWLIWGRAIWLASIAGLAIWSGCRGGWGDRDEGVEEVIEVAFGGRGGVKTGRCL